MSMFSEHEDLDVVWARLITECNTRAEWDLDSNRKPTVEGVLAKLKPPKRHKAEAHETTKKIFRQTLYCVDKFGSIAAQAASIAFGPSQQCFNAISFVIGAVQDYDAVFDNVTSMMERMAAFLERLRIFLDDQKAEEKVDQRMRLDMYRVLEHFVTVLSIWHKLAHSRTARLKLAAKVTFFGEDEGVGGAMEKLEILIRNYTDTQISLIVKTVSDSARNILVVERKIDTIVDSAEKTTTILHRLENDGEEQKRVDEIREAMGVDKDKRPWERKQREIFDKRTANTGKWLLNYEQPYCSFVRWSNPTKTCLSVLSVVAEGGYGKSVLASIVVDHLRARYGSDPKICIAHCYLERDTTSIKDIIKTLIFQLASGSNPASKEYAKLVKRECVGKGDPGTAADVWKRFVSAFASSLKATFFIVIDGIDEKEKEGEKPLRAVMDQIMSADNAASLQIRLLITGRPDSLGTLKLRGERGIIVPVPSISIAPDGVDPHNQEDILLHAQRRLDQMPIFDANDESQLRLKDLARDQLARGVKGNYIALESKLDALSKCTLERDAEEVISRAQESREDEIARKITQLNITLSEQEKMELNELLMWTATCFSYLSLDQCKTVLLLRMNTKVLVSLESQIRSMYNFLFNIDKENKTLSLCAGIQNFLDEDRESRALAMNARTNTPADAIQDGEISLMKRVIRTHLRNILGDDDAYARFAFDDFLESKRTNQTSRIHLDKEAENHLKLAQACLMLVCDHQAAAEDSKSLQSYASMYFADHLLKCEDEVELDIVAVQEIGRKLIRLLRDPTLIDDWWDGKRVSDSYWWVQDPENASAVCRWLKRPVVQKVLQDMPTINQWVLENARDGPGAVAILTDVAKRVAQRWFDLEEATWSSCFLFVDGYLRNMHGKEPFSSPSVQNILAAEEWAKNCLGNASAEVQWNHCMAETFRANDYWKEAIVHYRKVIASGKHTWQLHFGLAKSLRANEEFEEAIKELNELLEENKDAIASEKADDYSDSYWESILPELAGSLMDAKHMARAEGIYKMMIDESFQRHTFAPWAMQAVTDLSRALAKQGKYHDTIAVLENLVSEPDEDAGNWLCLLLHTYADTDDIHEEIHAVARTADSLDFIAETYQSAIESARQIASKYSTFLSLRSQLAMLLWSNQQIEDRKMALELWQANLEESNPGGSDDDWETQWAKSQAVSKLTNVLMETVQSDRLTGERSFATPPLIDKLVGISMANKEDYIFDQRVTEVARLLHLMGDEERARNMVRQKLLNGFKTTEDNPTTFKYGYWLREMAGVLQALDDETNAVAAWCLAVPEKKDTTDENSGGQPTTAADHSGSSSQNEQQARSGAEPDSTDDGTSLDHQEMASSPQEVQLEGPLSNFCDGLCDKRWTYADDMWVCKDCADIQFHPACYDKLKNGTLERRVCNPLHHHFYIPPFQKEQWLATPADQMWVDGNLMPKKDWVEKIRVDWKIDEKTLLAVKTIESSKVAGDFLRRRQTLPV